MTIPDPLPPCDLEAEAAVLGSLIIDPGALPSVAAFLKPQDFYQTKAAWVYEALLSLGDRADSLTIATHLSAAGRWDECGGDSYIAELTTSVPTALNVCAYAEIVKRKALSRRMVDAAQLILRSAYDTALAGDTLVDMAQSALMRAASYAGTRHGMTLDDAIDAFWADFTEMLETGIVPGIPTGISAFDYMVGGWKRGRLTVFGALPGYGKTTIMINTMLHAAHKGHRGVFVSLEQEEPELIETIAAHEAGVDISPEAMLKMSKRDQGIAVTKIADGLAVVRTLPLHPLYMPGASPADVMYEVKRIEAQYGKVELAAFDYVQLGRPSTASKNNNREQEVNYVALGLKEVAGKCGLHMLTGSQVNENGETRESRAITQHADTVIYLKKSEDRPSNETLLSLDADFWKNRKGKTGNVPLVFRKSIARIAGMEK